MPQVVVQEAGSPLMSLIRGHPNISAAWCNLVVHQPEIPREGMTRHLVILIHTHTVVEEADQKHCYPLQFRTTQTRKWRYTSLKIPLDEVYEAIKERGLLYIATLITKLPNRRDRGRYCKFHNTYGHTTTECRDLKIQIKDLVRNRYLDEFIYGTFPMVNSSDEGGRVIETWATSSLW